jgi:hypothetical protein
MTGISARFALGILLLLLPGADAWAQATGAISGTARDQSGGVLPGVTITVTQQETGVVRTTVSNDTGSYALPNLPLGPWRVEAELPGFNTFTQTGVILQVGTNAVVNLVMGVGTVSEQVSVTAAAPTVDTRTVGVGTVVESQRIVELPLNAREVTQLVTISGAAVQTGTGGGVGAMRTGVLISVAGGGDNGVSYYLDGAPHIDNLSGSGLHLPFPDALQEFRLTTGAQEAGANIRAAASVNAVTKAGTNLFHGGAFEFLRDSRFNEPDPISGRNDELKRNQFGGTLGGPIVRDKLFFFAGLQGTTTRQNPLNQTAFVPTAAMRAGDFRAFASPACNNGRQLTLGGGFVNNTIDPARLSPAALNIARRLPTPIDECGRVLFGVPIHRDEYQVPIRVDFQANNDHAFLFRYMLTTDDLKQPLDVSGGNLLTTGTPAADDSAHNITSGHTWVMSSTMVNSLRVFGNIVDAYKPSPIYFSPRDVGIDAFTYAPGLTFLSVQGGFTLGQASFGEGITNLRNAGVSDSLTVVKGAHQFNFGGYYLWTKTDIDHASFSGGQYTFTGQVSSNALADFMLGRITGNARASTRNIQVVTQPMAGAFASDAWKINNVTLNYGVVWNPFLPLKVDDGSGYTFDRDAFLAGTRSTVFSFTPPGFAYPGDAGFHGSTGVKSRMFEFDPRAGFAWDVTGDGRTALRGGAGLSHDYLGHNVFVNNGTVSPFRLTVALAGQSLDAPYATFPGGVPFPYTFNPNNPSLAFPAYTSFLPFPPELDSARQYSWNLGLQRQITSRWSAAATYIGNKRTNVLLSEEQNPALNLGFGPCTLYDGTIGGPRAYPVCTVAANVHQRRALNLNPANPLIPNTTGTALGYLTQYTDLGYSDYHGLLLSTRFDLARLWTLDTNYTLSECVGTPPLGNQVNLGDSTLHSRYVNNDAFVGDISKDEGPCPSDRRHLFNLTSVFRTPEFNGLLGLLASNWSASSVFQMRSGAPVNVTTGSDVALNGVSGNTATQRPNIVSGVDPYGDRDALTGYFNIAAFSQPASGTYGDASYNMLRGPGFWQWDQSFVRGFDVGSTRRVELRVEIINVTNHFNKGNPAAALNNAATFGRITSAAGTPRVWQFAAKYNF